MIPFGEYLTTRVSQAKMVEMLDLARAEDPVAVRRITPFVRPLINPDQLPPDYPALLSLTFGVAGLMLKVCYWFGIYQRYRHLLLLYFVTRAV